MNNETTNNQTTLIAILDSVGRTVIGEILSEHTNNDVFALKNPVVLHIVPQDQTGRMSVQLLPLFFREFLADKTGDVVFEYKKATSTEIKLDALDFRLQAQYTQLFSKNNMFVSPQTSQESQEPNKQGSVINLFDE
jgi:hypothetical protein